MTKKFVCLQNRLENNGKNNKKLKEVLWSY